MNSLGSPTIIVYHKSGKIASMSFPKDQVRNKYEIDPEVSLGSNILAVCSLEGLVDVSNRTATAAVVSRFQRKLVPVFQQLVRLIDGYKDPESPFECWETLESNANHTISSLVFPLVFRASVLWRSDIQDSLRPPLWGLVSFIEKIVIPLQVAFRAACLHRDPSVLEEQLSRSGDIQCFTTFVLAPQLLENYKGYYTIRDLVTSCLNLPFLAYIKKCKPCGEITDLSGDDNEVDVEFVSVAPPPKMARQLYTLSEQMLANRNATEEQRRLVKAALKALRCKEDSGKELSKRDKQLRCLRKQIMLTDDVVFDILNEFKRWFPERVKLQGIDCKLLDPEKRMEIVLGNMLKGLLPRWDRNMTDKCIWPYCSNLHWILIVVHLQQQTVVFYDSLGGDHPIKIQALKNLFADIKLNLNDDYWNPEGWTFRTPRSLPRQTAEDNDCGVFTVMWGLMEALNLDKTRIPNMVALNDIRLRLQYALLKAGEGNDNAEWKMYNLEAASFVAKSVTIEINSP